MDDERRRSRIEGAVRDILDALEVDKGSEMYKNTPKRVARMYANEIFAGMHDTKEISKITLFKNPGYEDMLCTKGIPFYSMCAHHLLPMMGSVSIVYIPGDYIVGLSKLPRMVKHFSERPQVQEELTKDLADFIQERLKAKGVLVLVRARHLCMEMRGAKAHGTETISSAIRGSFRSNPATKEEALNLLTH